MHACIHNHKCICAYIHVHFIYTLFAVHYHVKKCVLKFVCSFKKHLRCILNMRYIITGEVDEERLHHGKSSFPQSVMVSAGISNLGKTSLYLIERVVKVDSEYYCQSLLSRMIPEVTALSGNGNFIFQQDGARSHTSKYALPYMEKNLPPNAELLSPDHWPPHSPDLNPMDYSIWSSLAAKVFQVKIRSVEHLCERLGEAWEQISRDEVDRVIHSFRRCLKACIKAEGKLFEYKLGMKS